MAPLPFLLHVLVAANAGAPRLLPKALNAAKVQFGGPKRLPEVVPLVAAVVAAQVWFVPHALADGSTEKFKYPPIDRSKPNRCRFESSAMGMVHRVCTPLLPNLALTRRAALIARQARRMLPGTASMTSENVSWMARAPLALTSVELFWRMRA